MGTKLRPDTPAAQQARGGRARPRPAGMPPPVEPPAPTHIAPFRALVEQANDVMLILDGAGAIRYSNPASAAILGVVPELLAGRSFVALVAPEDQASADQLLQRVRAGPGDPARLEVRMGHPDGRPRTCMLTCRNLLHDPSIAGLMVVVRDITLRATAEAALRSSEAMSRGVLNALPAQVAVLDAAGTIMTVNSMWLDTAEKGGDPGAATTGIGANYLEVCRRAAPADHDAAVTLKGLEAVLDGELPLFTHEYPCDTPQGLRWYLVYITPLEPGAVMAHFDITSRKQLEQRHEALIAQLHDLAQTDALTGMANRRAFMEGAERAWQQALRSGQSLGVILLDVDHFKQINDTHGHQAGDQVLREVAARCQTAVRPIDLIGRYGGEEFAILTPDVTYGGALLVAEQLRKAVARAPVAVGEQTLWPTVSVGVVVGTPPAESIETLLGAADSALYAAKRGGRNRVVASRGNVILL